jgi:hypothetical protein
MTITPDDIINSAYQKQQDQLDKTQLQINELIVFIALLLEKGFNGTVTFNEKELTEMNGKLASGKIQRSIKVNQEEKTVTIEIKPSE